MKHFILAKGLATALTTVTDGYVGAYELTDNPSIATTALSKDFAIFFADGTRGISLTVDKASLEVTKAAAADAIAAATYAASFTVSAATAGKEYSLTFSKHGVPFNARNNWTVSYVAKASDTTTTIAAALARKITENGSGDIDDNTLGLSATNSTNTVNIAGLSGTHFDYTVSFNGALEGTSLTVTTHGTEGTLNAAHMRNLAIECAQNKGYNHTYEGSKKLNKRFDEEIASGTYTLYTLKFRNPRKDSVTVDEQVNQIIHIATSEATVVTRLDTLFGTGSAQAAGGSGSGTGN